MSSEQMQDRRRTSAHRDTVRIPVDDLVSALVTKLGARMVALIVGKDTSTVSRWNHQQAHPGEESTRRLRTAYEVFRLLENEEADPTIRAWFIGMNPQLEDTSPAEALADDKHREVLAAARAFLAGG